MKPLALSCAFAAALLSSCGSAPTPTPEQVPLRGSMTLNGDPLKALDCDQLPRVLIRKRGKPREDALPLALHCDPATRVLAVEGLVAPGPYEEVFLSGRAEGLPDVDAELLLLDKVHVVAPETRMDLELRIEEFSMEDFAPEEIRVDRLANRRNLNG